MISDAMLTQEYFDTMNSLDGDLAGKRSARAYMDQSSAIVHHRVVGASFIPRLYNDEVWERFRFISETIHTILCKVIERYRNDESYRMVFDYDPRLVKLILLRCHPPLRTRGYLPERRHARKRILRAQRRWFGRAQRGSRDRSQHRRQRNLHALRRAPPT